MKGVILAGGLGTRLYPLTHATNKHLLPVYDQPMIYYPIQTLVSAGVTEIMIVTGGPHSGDFLRVIKNGKQLGITHLEYAYQEGEGGIADALRLAEDFADGDDITVILGDNCTDANLVEAVQNFKSGAMVFLRAVPDPHRFGVPVLDGDKITKIEEKPKKPKSNYAVTGLYIYDKKVFKYINQIKPSARGELEITDVNNFYAKAGQLKWASLRGFWSDAGTFESLFRTAEYWAQKAAGKVETITKISEIKPQPRKKVITYDVITREPNGHLIELYKNDKKTVCYLTAAKPGAFKGYHLHTIRESDYVCLRGKMKITVVSPDKKTKKIITLDATKPERLLLPTNVYIGLENIGNDEAWLVNFPHPAFDPDLTGEQIDKSRLEIEK